MKPFPSHLGEPKPSVEGDIGDQNGENLPNSAGWRYVFELVNESPMAQWCKIDIDPDTDRLVAERKVYEGVFEGGRLAEKYGSLKGVFSRHFNLSIGEDGPTVMQMAGFLAGIRDAWEAIRDLANSD